jgi:hypothetical protein
MDSNLRETLLAQEMVGYQAVKMRHQLCMVALSAYVSKNHKEDWWTYH